MKLDHIQSLASYNRLVSLGNFTPAEAAWELLRYECRLIILEPFVQGERVKTFSKRLGCTANDI